jgi:hypothetical protein
MYSKEPTVIFDGSNHLHIYMAEGVSAMISMSTIKCEGQASMPDKSINQRMRGQLSTAFSTCA